MGECDVGRALAVSAKKPIRSNLAPPHSPLRKLAGQHIPQVGVTTSLRPATDSYVAEPGCCNRYQLEAAAVSVNRASGPMPATSPPIAFAAAPGARRSTAKGRPSSLQTHASPPPAAFSTRTAPSRYAPHRREVGPTWQGRRKRLGRIAPLSLYADTVEGQGPRGVGLPTPRSQRGPVGIAICCKLSAGRYPHFPSLSDAPPRDSWDEPVRKPPCSHCLFSLSPCSSTVRRFRAIGA